jgi:hypothetical protein
VAGNLFNNVFSNPGMYWMMSGLPFIGSTTSVGTGRWDGSRWSNSSNQTSVGVDTGNYLLNQVAGGNSSMTGASNYGGPTGNSGPFSNEALGQAAFGGGVNSLGSSLGSLGKQAGMMAGAGMLAGLSPGQAVSAGLSSVANPNNFAGVLGGMVNNSFGYTGVSSKVQGIVSGVLGAINPGLGLAASIFGGPVLDGLMDAMDMRSMEVTRDTVEDMAGDYFGGRIAGAQFAGALAPDNQMGMNNLGQVANTVGMSLGANLTDQQLGSILGAAYTDALGNTKKGTSIMGEHLADKTMGAYNEALGQVGDAIGWGGTIGGDVGSLGSYGPDVSPEALGKSLDDALGNFGTLGGYTTPTGVQGVADMGVSSGLTADVTDTAERASEATTGGDIGNSSTGKSSDKNSNSDHDSDADGDSGGNDRGGGDGDGTSGSGGMGGRGGKDGNSDKGGADNDGGSGGSGSSSGGGKDTGNSSDGKGSDKN